MSNTDPIGRPAPRPGWYPDPLDAARERYWDGQSWTHELRNPAEIQPATSTWQPRQQPVAPSDNWAGGASMAAVQGPQTTDGYPLAGWWQRVGANLIDGLAILALTLLAGAPLLPGLVDAFQGWYSDAWYAATVGRSMPDYTDPKYGIIDSYTTIFLINRGVGMLYSTALQVTKGATLGMLALGLRVVPEGEGTRQRGLPLMTAIIRNLVFGVAGLFWVAQLVNCLAPLATRKRQALHDMPARTQVIKTR